MDGELLGPIEVFRALPEAEQDKMTAYVTELCPNCGNLRSVCSDPTVSWYPQRSVCYASAVRDVAWRKVHKKHPGPEPKSGELHETDGMVVWASQHDLTPDDHFI